MGSTVQIKSTVILSRRYKVQTETLGAWPIRLRNNNIRGTGMLCAQDSWSEEMRPRDGPSPINKARNSTNQL